MRKSTFVSLVIPHPCTEDWDAMTLTGGGKHCASCCKTVVDFTGWSDAALAVFFSKEENSMVCGRFLPQQLDRRLAIPHQPSSKLYRWVMAAGIASITLTAIDAKGQQAVPRTLFAETNPIAVIDRVSDYPVRSTFTEISGTVTDEKGEPLINATIQLTQAGITIGGAVSDIDGAFAIKSVRPLDVTDTTVEIQVSYISYITYRGFVLAGQQQRIQLARATGGYRTSNHMTLGAMVIIHTDYVSPILNDPSRTVLTGTQIEQMH